MTENWRKAAIAALGEAKAEIEAATEPTLFVVISVTDVDLLHLRPVSFFGNFTPEALGPFLSYCASRVAEKFASPTGLLSEAARVQHVKRGSTYRVLGNAKVQTGTPLPDDAEVVIYQSESDGDLWVRPPSEFNDGRFREIAADVGGE